MSDPLAELAPTLQSSNTGEPQYLCGSHQQILGKLEHLGRFSPVVQILTGPQGAGKSTLLKQLNSVFPHHEAVSISIRSDYETDDNELLSIIAEALGIESNTATDSANLLTAITQELQSLRSSHRFLFIQIDNGESLGSAALNLLLNSFQTFNESIRPHILIAGQPVFADKIKDSPYAASIPESLCHYAELPPLDLSETTAFIQHNFPEEAALLNKSRITHIHQRSFGLPGKIEKALQQEITTPATTTKQTNAGKLIGTSVLAAALIAVSAGAIYMLWGLYTQPTSDNDQVSISLPTPIEQPKSQTTPSPTPESIEIKNTPAITETTLKATPKEAVAPSVAMTKQPDGSDTQNPDNLEIAQATNPSTDKDNQPPVLTTPAKNKLVLQLKPAEPKQPNPTPKALEASQAKTSSTQPPTTKVNLTKTIIRPSNPLLREDELLSWNSNGYTLQMLGARKESSVISFIQSRSDKSNFYYFSTVYKEKPWYVVVHGQYQNRDAAVAAIRTLPNDLKQRKPWARSINGVQDDIRRK